MMMNTKWNSFPTVGHSGRNLTMMGPNFIQKRDLSMHSFDSVQSPIIQSKTFANPNFVNKSNPLVHSYSTRVQNLCQNTSHLNSSKVNNVNTGKDPSDNLPNPSHIIDIFKQLKSEPSPPIGREIVNVPAQPIPAEMCNRKYSDKGKRGGKRYKTLRSPGKGCKQFMKGQMLDDMMDEEMQVEAALESSPQGNSSGTTSITLKCFLPCDIYNQADSSSDSEMDDCELAELICASPSKSASNLRQRQLSVTESEDSFIVFVGTDDETEESEDEDNEPEDDSDMDDEEMITNEDDVDCCGSPVIPRKRVRFAADDDLCTVHPMIQWSFAYQAARKGYWEVYARDRCRFKRRIGDMEKILGPVLTEQHRSQVYHQRFDGSSNDINM